VQHVSFITIFLFYYIKNPEKFQSAKFPKNFNITSFDISKENNACSNQILHALS